MNSEAKEIRAVIEGFLEEGLQGKLEKLEKDLAKAEDSGKRATIQEKIETVKAQYPRETWIESATKRIGQLQIVHFAAKFTNPSSKSSSCYLSLPFYKKGKSLVTTSTITAPIELDVVGNAAALDTFKFLSLRYNDNSLLDLVLDNNKDLASAMSADDNRSIRWLACFADIVKNNNTAKSHQYAKQVYFPVNDSEYHLLSPLFPTSLVHAQYQAINESRFSEQSKEARKASREKKWCAHGYSEYKNLTIQKFGGLNPQNISQLNLQRGGKVYLLASCPPTWNKTQLRAPVGVTSVFKRLLYQNANLRETTTKLKKFLSATDYNSIHIRQARARMVQSICDEVLFVASGIQALDSGWSAAPSCKLDEVEALWLDPGRAEFDLDFSKLRDEGDYLREITSRFAKWLNAALKTDKQVLGEVEYKEWQTQLLGEIRNLPMEIY